MHNQFNQKLNIMCIYHLALANNKLNERYLRNIYYTYFQKRTCCTPSFLPPLFADCSIFQHCPIQKKNFRRTVTKTLQFSIFFFSRFFSFSSITCSIGSLTLVAVVIVGVLCSRSRDFKLYGVFDVLCVVPLWRAATLTSAQRFDFVVGRIQWAFIQIQLIVRR